LRDFSPTVLKFLPWPRLSAELISYKLISWAVPIPAKFRRVSVHSASAQLRLR
jgi:hypothetical protein